MARMSDGRRIPYGAWPSPITADRAAAASVGLSETRAIGDTTTWLERRPQERGRSVVVRATPGAEPVDVTPPGVSVRTRVHEYGGGSYTVAGAITYFVNLEDQRLYRQELGGAPSAITPEPGTPGGLRYAGMNVSPDGRWIASVHERHQGEGMPVNELVVIPADGSAMSTLASGRDFYAFPRWSADGARIAFLAWDFPRMPWDGTELLVVEVASDGSAGPSRVVAGGERESIFQPAWGPDGSLSFVSDRTDWWNLYREGADGDLTNLTPMSAGRAARLPKDGEHLAGAVCRAHLLPEDPGGRTRRSSPAARDREPSVRWRLTVARRSAHVASLGVCERGRGGPGRRPDPPLERGRVPLVADGTYLGPVKGRRRVDVRVVNASA
jgi:hypothetical protein